MMDLMERFPILKKMQRGEEIVWINPDYRGCAEPEGLSMADIDDAERRLVRSAPLIMKCFPETAEAGGIIESALTPIPAMQQKIGGVQGRLLLKQDSHLPIAGSVKARGGIYEVLKHTEELALANGLLKEGDSYDVLTAPEAREFFGRHMVQVGSTGNLGMSIGIMSAAIGYRAVVHMSADARQWKKDLLRNHGVTVIEYESDYSEAVRQGRALSDANPMSYFVDDENSKNLFMGYAVAAKRLPKQLEQLGVCVDAEHPLFVYIPCGVGGAPGGVTFGLKQVYGEHVHCFFVEPTQAPCMAVGMLTGLNSEISVQDVGLSGLTHADGLAVGRPSGFVGGVMKPILSGECTVRDAKLYDFMRAVLDTEGIFLEPSACAAFQGPAMLGSGEMKRYMEAHGLTDKLSGAAHIVWATGGRMVPEDVREAYRNTYL